LPLVFNNSVLIQWGCVNSNKGSEGTLITFPITYIIKYLVYACKMSSHDNTTDMCDCNWSAYCPSDLSSFYFLNRTFNGEMARPVWLSIGY